MPRFINNDCVACGSCLPECAFGAISEGDIYVIDPEKCTDCAACEPVCPSNAIHQLNLKRMACGAGFYSLPFYFTKLNI